MPDRPSPDYHAIVRHPFEVYNGIFLTLPLDGIRATGLRVPLLQEVCESGLALGEKPSDIMERFFAQLDLPGRGERLDLLYRIVQYIERQVVLVDALEDARYGQLHALQGEESLPQLMQRVRQAGEEVRFRQAVEELGVRVVLTAQSTPFYPGTALGIVSDLAAAMEQNDLVAIRKLLHQLGLTPFFPSAQPTVQEAATRQLWYLENVFYDAGSQVLARLAQAMDDPRGLMVHRQLLALGSWPGADGSDQPGCSPEDLYAIALRYKVHLLRCYRREIRQVRRRITFKEVAPALERIQEELDAMLRQPELPAGDPRDLDARLDAIAAWVDVHCDGLFVEWIRMFQYRLRMMGYHLAALDVRLSKKATDEATALAMLQAARRVQVLNGEAGCHRCLVGGFEGPEDLYRWFGWAATAFGSSVPPLDFVPVLESIPSLDSAPQALESLLKHPAYRAHLSQRGDTQTFMFGFSDCVMDGGYLFANWSILQAKQRLNTLAEAHGVTVVFLDGRGGPASRGGRYTHRYYTALGKEVAQRQIQTTIQGSTISSNFGVPRSAAHNLELLLTAGLEAAVFHPVPVQHGEAQEALFELLAQESRRAYEALKALPGWSGYLKEALGMATPDSASFVAAWTQVKQNVPGYFGLGTALARLEGSHGLSALMNLYTHHDLFRAWVDNSMQSMCKCDFRLTKHWADHPDWGPVWSCIEQEFQTTRHWVLRIAELPHLMANQPATRDSIALRNHLTRPLHVIQRLALESADPGDHGVHSEDPRAWERLAQRAGFGISNASRNAV